MARAKYSLILASAAYLCTTGAMAANYSNFQVSGSGRIDPSIVLGVAGLSNGTAVSDAGANAALQRLYASGLFSSVEMVPSGNTLIIKVQENATIGRIYFEGNRNEDDDVLQSIISIGPRDGLDRAKVEEEAQTIRRYYASKSRFDAEVRPVIIPVADGVFNVVYEINEGTISDVERVTFTGNQNVSDWQLRRVINTGETNFASNIFSRDNFASEKLVSDQARLENYYQEHGFYNAQIKAVSADYNALGDYYLTYAINEGRQYRFGQIQFSSDIPGISATRYTNLVKSDPGKIYKASDVRETIESIEEAAAREGYPFLRVQPIVTPDEATGQLNIRYAMTQGSKVYVDRIDIHGNESTIDRVIRRQFDLVEGDPMNERKVVEARQRLEQTGFFSRVAVTARESGVEGKQIIDVEVEEANTGSLGFGASYSPEGGASVFASLSENNFLGRGQFISTRVDIGQVSQSGSLSFREPGLFERDLAAGFDLYYRQSTQEGANYQTTDLGFEPYVSFPVTDNSRLNLRYFIRSNEIRDVAENVSPLIVAEEGEVLTSGVSATWTWDELNAFNNPTRGWIARLGGAYAGIGGDANWYQLSGRAKMYYPVFNDDVIFSATLEGGMIESSNELPIRINERYFLGGSSFIGFAPMGIGPRDKSGDINSALGGKYYGSLLTELRFPVGLPDELGIKGSVFYQAGSVWGLDQTAGGASGVIDDDFYLRQSVGASLLWDVGGSYFRFSYANAFDHQEYDITDSFSVSLETRF